MRWTKTDIFLLSSLLTSYFEIFNYEIQNLKHSFSHVTLMKHNKIKNTCKTYIQNKRLNYNLSSC